MYKQCAPSGLSIIALFVHVFVCCCHLKVARTRMPGCDLLPHVTFISSLTRFYERPSVMLLCDVILLSTKWLSLRVYKSYDEVFKVKPV